MKEIRDIIAAYDACLKKGKEAALATVVQVQGSSYRRPGARMLVTEDGKLTGAISGGCLEGDALRKALLVMSRHEPMLVTYDTTDEDDVLGIGLGCNGIIKIFIEPIIGEQQNSPINLLKILTKHRDKAVLATVFYRNSSSKSVTGTSFLYLGHGEKISNVQDIVLNDSLTTDAETTLTDEQSATITYNCGESTCGVFIDYIGPATSLVIIGAGNDVIPLVAFVNIAGWQVTVIDGRPNYATALRFPTAQHVMVSKPEKITSLVTFDQNTVVLLMTHNYKYDLAALQQIVNKDVPYIGILGPHKKQEKLIEDLQAQGILVDDIQAKLFGPVGLDIGAETPEEIAISIIAEIKKVLASGTGLSLREKKSSIHNRHANMPLPFII